MKTLTALIMTLTTLSTVYASGLDSSDPVAGQLPIAEEIAIALADDATPAGGECKAVCSLPVSFDEDGWEQ